MVYFRKEMVLEMVDAYIEMKSLKEVRPALKSGERIEFSWGDRLCKRELLGSGVLRDCPACSPFSSNNRLLIYSYLGFKE